MSCLCFQASKKQEQAAAGPDDEVSLERQEELKRKVQELKARLEAKKLARARYDAYVQQKDSSAPNSTDYEKWDLWCPEDEDDELLASCTPNNEQMKAMEKDIDERHARYAPNRWPNCSMGAVLERLGRTLQDGEGQAAR